MNTAKNLIPQILPRMVGAKFFSILLVASVFSLSSCDEASIVGLDVQPEGDLLNVGFQDTTTLFTKTMLIDSLQTDESIVTNGTALLGKYIDPVFGEASASIYTQVRLISNSPNFGSLPVCESVVLSLRYNGTVYGKTNLKPQTVSVYQVNEGMSTGSSYFSNQTLDVLPNDITVGDGYTFTPEPYSKVIVYGDSLKPQVRIPLDIEWGQTILNNQGTSNLSSDVNFRNFMKGLYITCDGTNGLNATDGNILHLNMSESQVTIYYSNPSTGLQKRKSYSFSLGSVARFNHFNHNFTSVNPYLADQIDSTPSSINDLVFLQSMAGLKTKIEMPYLMNWIDSGMIAINKAELIIKEYNEPESFSSKLAAAMTFPFTGMYAVPETLIVFGISDSDPDVSTVLPDFGEGTSYFGGAYNSTTKEYRFNIARHIQQILSGTVNNNGLYLFNVGGSSNARRIVIGGGKPGPYQMKLNITYTKLN